MRHCVRSAGLADRPSDGGPPQNAREMMSATEHGAARGNSGTELSSKVPPLARAPCPRYRRRDRRRPRLRPSPQRPLRPAECTHRALQSPWFLGFRHNPAPPIGNVLVWWWAFIGAFSGILVVEAVFHTERLQAEGVPIVIASLGAAAILEYNTIDSPLAQPRNAMLGQIFSATIGISITKLFHLSPYFESLRWVAGALSVAVASALMGSTKTIHPPAGATALLCSTEPSITALGWLFLPMIILETTLLLAVALLLNNIQRQFPVYWWTPADLKPPVVKDDIERAPSGTEEKIEEGAAKSSSTDTQVIDYNRIVVDKEHIIIPDWIALDDEEKGMLEILRAKLRNGYSGN